MHEYQNCPIFTQVIGYYGQRYAYFASRTELGQSSAAYLTSSLRHRTHLFLSGPSDIIDCSVTSGGMASDSRLKSDGRPESK